MEEERTNGITAVAAIDIDRAARRPHFSLTPSWRHKILRIPTTYAFLHARLFEVLRILQNVIKRMFVLLGNYDQNRPECRVFLSPPNSD